MSLDLEPGPKAWVQSLNLKPGLKRIPVCKYGQADSPRTNIGTEPISELINVRAEQYQS
jgi:hypothetical protein